MTLHITSAFDGGNIIANNTSDPSNIRLSIRKDNASDFYQWFYYRVSGGRDQDLHMVIDNAKHAAFTGGWEGYLACASYDRETWFRVETAYENDVLTITHTPEHDSVYYAYFAPYSMERHADLIASCLQETGVSHRVLGQTIQGQDLDCLSVGDGEKVIWVIARQHPGETMAEWWMEGFLSRLLDEDDPVARVLRQKARFHIVPNMNPDGSKNGNLRTNESGANLNREWGIASVQSAPEVYHTIAAMDADKPDLCLDVHGDEALPYNFIAAAEGIPGYTEKQAKSLNDFLSAYKISSPDFQTDKGYALTAPGTANLTMCTNYTAHAYDCLAMTLEMPFKDNANLPDSDFGWSADRSAKLGAAALDPMLAVVDQL
jgi:murein tripeptide amidase MpaA